MKSNNDLEIFLTTAPGLEALLHKEVIEKGFRKPKSITGGVTIKGSWKDVWRANLEVRGASRVLVRLGSFKVNHLAKLDKLARDFPWSDTLRPKVPVRVEVTCKKSRIYHDKAAAERIERAIHEELGAEISPDADICIKARIVNDICTISVDTSGEALHKRGHKEGVSKAPMRENIAALLLRACGFKGNEPVIDPMCGSGTFVIEAAEIASRLKAGRSRHFAFEHMVPFDDTVWRDLKDPQNERTPDDHFYGFDRDSGAIRAAKTNAERASLSPLTDFDVQSISDLRPPKGPDSAEGTDDPVGLVIINPPYGVRIGETKHLLPLYQTMGQVLKSGFSGWRVGLVTSSDSLAHATGLPFTKSPTAFSHGGLSVKLYTTEALE